MTPKIISKEEMLAYKSTLRKFGNRSNVTAVDIGYKYKDGKILDILAIRIHVREKIPLSLLEVIDIFPESVEGIPVDIIEAVYQPHANFFNNHSLEDLAKRQERFDTLVPGISIAHKNVGAGTLGAFVIENKTGKLAILSNWHILAGSLNAKPGDEITQPAPFDGGRPEHDTVATLERMILDNDGDAGIALLNGKRPLMPIIFETNVFLKGVRNPTIGDILVKSGRTTGVTYGMIDGIGNYFLNYSVGEKRIDGFKIVPRKPGNPDNDEISSRGDSGSIWYDPNSYEAVGLHFAGEITSEPSEEYAISCYASKVFKRLNISLPTSPLINNTKPTDQINIVTNAIDKEEMDALAKEIGNQAIEIVLKRFSASNLIMLDLISSKKKS